MAFGLVLGTGTTGCLTPATETVEAAAGEPLPGLAQDELQRFLVGKVQFNREFSVEEGLGPLFNQARCSSCHDLPSSGGHGAESVRKASRFQESEGCDLFPSRGGDLLQRSVTDLARDAGVAPRALPPEATAFSDLMPPPLYGLGLVAALPLEAVEALADPEDRDGDGISGRLGHSAGGEAGFFGMKSTHPTLDAFIEGATRGEMGLTTPGLPDEVLGEGEPLPPGSDPTSDPEVDQAFLDALTDYVAFLAVPSPPTPATREDAASAARGRQYFEALGCQGCHVPTWTSGEHASSALSGRTFLAYSDFLLHDMGPEVGDICGPDAGPREWRTPRLVGLHLRRVFLHDGRAQSLTAAIEYHGGEADRSRLAFLGMPEGAKSDLIRFLQGL